jgi:hypothetical protein
MSPGLTINDSRDMTLVDIEPCHQQSITNALSMQLAYEQHVIGSELGESMSFSGWSPRAALDRAISDILQLGSEEPMIRSLTRRVVTTMQDAKTIRDRTDQHQVSPSMDSDSLLIRREDAIAITRSGSGPRPTSIGIRAVNPGEISLDGGHHFKRYQRSVR